MLNFTDTIEDYRLLDRIGRYVSEHNINHIIFDYFETLVYPKTILDEESLFRGKSIRNRITDLFIRCLHSGIVMATGKELTRSYVGRFFLLLKQHLYCHNLNNYVPRKALVDLLHGLALSGKRISIVTNSCYSETSLRKIVGLETNSEIVFYVSGQVGFTKSQGLIEYCMQSVDINPCNTILIGDDEKQDICTAKLLGIQAFHLEKISERLEPVLGREQFRLMVKNLFYLEYLRKFSSCFVRNPQLTLGNAVGYFYSAPFALDLAQELLKKVNKLSFDCVFFLSREGYLVKVYFDQIKKSSINSKYLLVSRKLLQNSSGKHFLREQVINLDQKSTTALFDIGWRGNLITLVGSLIPGRKVNFLFGHWPWVLPKNRLHALYFGRLNFIKALRVRRCPELYEILLAAPHLSVETRILQNAGESSPAFQILDGCSKSDAVRILGNHSNFFSVKLLSSLIGKPSLRQANFFGALTHSGSGEVACDLVSFNTSTNRIFWLRGSRKSGNSNQLQRVCEIKRRLC